MTQSQLRQLLASDMKQDQEQKQKELIAANKRAAVSILQSLKLELSSKVDSVRVK